ncbi:hypothetical protein MTR67_045959 [Solanum verrucosum]|uniref:Uncharacterized protein n=1 Tax=Solanum verrucosum TaxID=315347 RepID=A0AAF0UW68_SOLVR|nr:hypothetical protein MTR67_045959 [Solanum verrucosum]
MDTTNPAVFVNAELLRLYMGRRVRAVIQVMRSDGGGTVNGRSTDDQQIVVKGNPPGPLTTFVEVTGIADSNQSIRAEAWSNFGDNLGTTSNHSINILLCLITMSLGAGILLTASLFALCCPAFML